MSQDGSLFGGVLGNPESVVSSTGCNRKGNREGGILNLGSVHKPNREEENDFYAIANVLAPPWAEDIWASTDLRTAIHLPEKLVQATEINQPDKGL